MSAPKVPKPKKPNPYLIVVEHLKMLNTTMHDVYRACRDQTIATREQTDATTELRRALERLNESQSNGRSNGHGNSASLGAENE